MVITAAPHPRSVFENSVFVSVMNTVSAPDFAYDGEEHETSDGGVNECK